MDTLFETLLLVLCKIPGAAIRWLLAGCRKPIKEYIDHGDAYLDGMIGLTVIVLVIKGIKKLLS